MKQKNSAILHLVKEINKYDSSIECKIKEELINLSKFKYYLSEEECIELYEMYKSKSKEGIYTIPKKFIKYFIIIVLLLRKKDITISIF